MCTTGWRSAEVVGGGDVPGPDHGHVQHHREGGVRQGPGAALEVRDGARHRSQDHLREAQDREDRDEVQQQHVLDHVHEEEIVGERVHGDTSATSAISSEPAKQHRRHTGASFAGWSETRRTASQRRR